MMASIKTRAAVVVALMFVLLIVASGALQMRSLRADFARVISEQQFSLVKRVARDIDAKFESGAAVLGATASFIDAADIANVDGLREELRQHPALMAMFDDVLLVEPNGVIRMDFPVVAGRVGIDVSDRDFFRQVIATRRTAISEPVLGKTRREPIVQVGAPILDREGALLGVLVGVIRLYRATFLGPLGDERIGEQGYFVLITRGRDPSYVVHPDRKRILTPRSPNGAPAVTRALAGFEGIGESPSSLGVDTLYSSKLLRSVPWVLIAAAPTKEVFAPLQAAERRLWVVSAVTALAMLPLAWLCVWWLLAPLQRLRAAMVVLRDARGSFKPVKVERADEVGDLTAAFNQLMRRRLGAEEAQRESEARLRLLADHMPALISYLDREFRVRFANSCYRDWFGIEPASMIGHPLQEIFGREDFEQIREHHEAALNGYPAQYEREVMTLAGPRIVRTSLFPQADDAGAVTGIYRMGTDVSADRKLHRELDHQARRDALTGLHNRRSLEELLPEAIARNARAGRCIGVLFVDLDGFKAVNDNLGHSAGDEVLKAVAVRLEACVRVTDLVARFAGDEFVVVLENLARPAEAGLVAAKIIESLKQPIGVAAGEAHVGASIGVASCESDCPDAGELLRKADEAAYVAKGAGRGRFHQSGDPVESTP